MASFSMADLTVVSNGGTKAKGPAEGAAFGLAFTDHMLVIEHAAGSGWGAPVIKPFQNLSLHPSAQVLHYGMSCFEGMKAYKGVDGAPRLFRPQMNMKRFHKSCQRLMLPAFDTEELLKCIEALVKLDKDWLPEGEGSALYIRPFAMNTSAFLNLRPPNHATIVVTLSPSAQFFSTESKGEKLFLNETDVRAWPGGAGEHKLASNYGPTLKPHLEAGKEHGCIMVMFCLPQGPSPEDALISECAGMNVFFLLEKEDGKKELCTPPLDGTILPGVTRESVLELCRSWNEFEVSERNITVSELTTAAQAGRLLEVFGAGTAVTILPVVEIKREKGPDCKCRCECFADMQLTNRLRKTLFDIQLGHVEHEWSIKL